MGLVFSGLLTNKRGRITKMRPLSLEKYINLWLSLGSKLPAVAIAVLALTDSFVLLDGGLSGWSVSHGRVIALALVSK